MQADTIGLIMKSLTTEFKFVSTAVLPRPGAISTPRTEDLDLDLYLLG